MNDISEMMELALKDCISVFEAELKGLRVIQPELRAAKAAIALYEESKTKEIPAQFSAGAIADIIK